MPELPPPPPPTLATRWLRRRLPPDAFEPVAGDLEEGYRERYNAAGRASAHWWYWREAVGILLARHPDTEPAPSRWTLGPAMIRDLRVGLRTLMRHPAFACAAIAIMSLGIGTTTAVFSVLRGVLIEPLPYRDPGQLVVFGAVQPDASITPALTSLEFAAIRDRTDLFESVAAIVEASGSLTAPDIMAPLNAAAVSDGFLQTLGVTPVVGRALRAGDSGVRGSINISHEVWHRHFHGDPAIVGQPIEVNGEAMTVAGVLPREFKAYLGSAVTLPPRLDLLYRRGRGYDDDPFRGNVVIARLRRGVAIETARAAVDAIAARLVAEQPSAYPTGPIRLSVAPLDAEVVKAARPAVLAAAGAVLLVLVITCANLTTLLLSRASARVREMAIRASMGAGRGDIVRQLLAEGVVIGAAGGALGWIAAHWGVAILLALAPASLPRREAITVDGVMATFAVILALAAVVVVSLVPAWQASRPALAARARGARAGGTGRGLLVAAQLALSVALLVGAGLTARAFVNLRTVPLGFDPDQRISMFVSLSGMPWNVGSLDEARVRRRGFYEQLTDRAGALPGVSRAGAGFPVPLSGIVMSQRVALGPDARQRDVDGFIALAGYVEALGVPLKHGRYFATADNGQPAVMLDERLAADLWPGQSAIGKRLLVIRSVSAPLWVEVVGVVAHIQARDLRAAALPQIWMSYGVRSYAQLNVVVRAIDPASAAAQVRAITQELGAGRPVRDVRLLDEMVAAASADTRFAFFVLAVLSAVALSLAAVGVYGVVAFSMARRLREIAIRLSLGERPERIVMRVLTDGARWTTLGLGAGLALAAVLSRSIESLLFKVGPHDTMTFAAVATCLACVSLISSVIPAIRASRVDPMLALRRD